MMQTIGTMATDSMMLPMAISRREWRSEFMPPATVSFEVVPISLDENKSEMSNCYVYVSKHYKSPTLVKHLDW